MLTYDFNASNGPEMVERLQEDTLLKTEQVAAILGLSPVTIRKWQAHQGLKAVRIGTRLVRFRWGDVVDFLNKYQG